MQTSFPVPHSASGFAQICHDWNSLMTDASETEPARPLEKRRA